MTAAEWFDRHGWYAEQARTLLEADEDLATVVDQFDATADPEKKHDLFDQVWRRGNVLDLPGWNAVIRYLDTQTTDARRRAME